MEVGIVQDCLQGSAWLVEAMVSMQLQAAKEQGLLSTTFYRPLNGAGIFNMAQQAISGGMGKCLAMES